MKRILFSLMAVVLCLGLMGGAFAYFSDVETSEDNTFTAGTIDLAVNDQNPWSEEAEWDFVDIKPCQDLDPMTIRFQNVGNNEGVLYTCINYNELDKYENPEPLDFEFREMELSADQFAALLYVKAVTHQYFGGDYPLGGSIHNDLPNWMAMDLFSPGNNDGYLSLYELKQWSPIPWATTPGDTLPAGEASQFVVTFHLADSLTNWSEIGSAIVTGEDNRPQADGIEFIISGILVQVGAPAPTCP